MELCKKEFFTTDGRYHNGYQLKDYNSGNFGEEKGVILVRAGKNIKVYIDYTDIVFETVSSEEIDYDTVLREAEMYEKTHKSEVHDAKIAHCQWLNEHDEADYYSNRVLNAIYDWDTMHTEESEEEHE